MSKIILPFCMEPVAKAYHYKAFSLGMIQASIPKEHFDVWLCNKYINSVYGKTICLDSSENDVWSCNDGLTKVQTFDVFPSTLFMEGIDLITLIKASICNGNYVMGWFDEYYIPGKEPYQKWHFMHDYLLWGYDDEKRVFFSSGYTTAGRYEIFEISFENYCNSIQNAKADNIILKFYCINNDYVPSLDINHIKAEVEDYLLSRCSSKYSRSDCLYGFEAWSVFEKELENAKPDLRHARSFVEHRDIMVRRITTLINLGYIDHPHILDQYSESVFLRAKTMYMLSLKHNITKSEKELVRIKKLYSEIVKKERRCLESLLNSLA